MIFMYTINGVLYHHGIKGQKWGKRNGPPYPLNASAKSKAEKKAASNTQGSAVSKSSHSDRKRLIKIGAAVAIGTLAVAGGVYLAKTGTLQAVGRKAFQKYMAHETATQKKIHEIIKDINPNRKPGGLYDHQPLAESLHGENPPYPLNKVNCQACTLTYELKKRLGLDKVQQAQLIDTRKFSTEYLMNKFYKDAKVQSASSQQAIKAIKKMGNGARGNLIVHINGQDSHSIAFEVIGKKVMAIDAQNDIVVDLTSKKGRVLFNAAYKRPLDFMDFCRTDNLELNDLEFIKKFAIGNF